MPKTEFPKEYAAWQAAFRCCQRSKPEQPVTISDEFQDFETFLAYVGKAPSPDHLLDRIDHTKNYERGNIYWATAREKSCNRSDARLYEYKGRKLNILQIEPLLSCPVKTFKSRIDRGWDVEAAMVAKRNTPSRYAESISFRGQSKTLTQWAKSTGLSVATLYDRLNKLGWSVEQALTTSTERRKISHNGQEMTIKDWAKHLDIPESILYYRLSTAKWSAEKAFSAPVGSR